MGTRQRTGQTRPEEPIFTADSINQEPFLGPFTHSLTRIVVRPLVGTRQRYLDRTKRMVIGQQQQQQQQSKNKSNKALYLPSSYLFLSRPVGQSPWASAALILTMMMLHNDTTILYIILGRAKQRLWPSAGTSRSQRALDNLNQSLSVFLVVDGDNPCDTFYSSCACRLSLLPNW